MRRNTNRKLVSRLAAALLLAASAAILPAHADDAPPTVVTVTSPLIPWIGTRDRALPGSIDTMRQPEATLTDFRRFAEAFVAGDTETALGLQGKINYQITAAAFEGQTYFVAMDESGAGIGPTLVLNPAATRELILEAPHASFELGSGEQGALLMARLGARATLIGGAHRCASRTPSTCDGRTGVCGTLEAYRDSDAAHAIFSRFQVAHEVLVDAHPQAVVISLHGKAVDTKGARTEVIASNGIEKNSDPDHATAATQLRLALADHFPRPGALVSCNWPADQSFDYRTLCGTTNIQGRYVNKDPDICSAGTTTGTGLFIHLEQDWPMLTPFHNNWPTIDDDTYFNALAAALEKVERIKPVAASD
ncbi:hypothetical protein [Bauldia sp.]|uniref:hypothetical protein n=1 Tax=Bauldia sp. TaxID=2575872 RepID=UPI003BAA0FF5